MNELTPEFIKRLQSITSKRPATIIKHILEKGYITSEDIKNLYGYNHPPRAIRDVREQGIPIETYRVKDNTGRTIAAYRFGDPSSIENKVSKIHGRTALVKTLKEALIEKYGAKCFIYQQYMDSNLLQIDHRVPYEIGGDQTQDIEAYMLLSPSANRAKSWACEHCENWNQKDITFCSGCFWCHPENYDHIAGKAERRIVITFTDDEIADYNKLIKEAGEADAEQFIKNLIKSNLV